MPMSSERIFGPQGGSSSGASIQVRPWQVEGEAQKAGSEPDPEGVASLPRYGRACRRVRSARPLPKPKVPAYVRRQDDRGYRQNFRRRVARPELRRPAAPSVRATWLQVVPHELREDDTAIACNAVPRSRQQKPAPVQSTTPVGHIAICYLEPPNVRDTTLPGCFHRATLKTDRFLRCSTS